MIVQSIILIGGAITIYLLTRPDIRVRIIGCVFGLLVEPFWLYDAFVDGNWGIFILCVVYGLCYADGARKNYYEWKQTSLYK